MMDELPASHGDLIPDLEVPERKEYDDVPERERLVLALKLGIVEFPCEGEEIWMLLEEGYELGCDESALNQEWRLGRAPPQVPSSLWLTISYHTFYIRQP